MVEHTGTGNGTSLFHSLRNTPARLPTRGVVSARNLSCSAAQHVLALQITGGHAARGRAGEAAVARRRTAGSTLAAPRIFE
jgi:hypothetical protein